VRTNICVHILTSNSDWPQVDRNVNDSLKFNQETEFVPILGLVSSQLNASKPEDSDKSDSESDNKDSAPPKGPRVASSIQENHHSALLELLASELSVAAEEIHDFELCSTLTSPCVYLLILIFRSLYDTQSSTLGGLNNEFIFSPRMDNLVSS
jgi:aspartyl aminopeptidase